MRMSRLMGSQTQCVRLLPAVRCIVLSNVPSGSRPACEALNVLHLPGN